MKFEHHLLADDPHTLVRHVNVLGVLSQQLKVLSERKNVHDVIQGSILWVLL